MPAGVDATDEARVRKYATTFGGSSFPADLADTIDDIIESVSEQIELFIRNKLLRAERDYIPTIVRRWQRYIDLPHAPILNGADFTIWENQDRDFSDPLVGVIDADYYVVDEPKGMAIMDNPLGGRAGTVKVTSTGGYAASATVDALETAAPGVVLAATMWVAEVYRRRRTSTKVSIGGRGGSGATYTPMVGMPQQVKELLMPYRRHMFAR